MIAKIPKSIAAAVDLYGQIRSERLALKSKVTDLEAYEHAIKEYLITHISKQNATGVSGKLFSASIVVKEIPSVVDWEELYRFIIKNKNRDGFALLNKAVNAKSVAEIWSSGKSVPGVKAFSLTTISLRKLS